MREDGIKSAYAQVTYDEGTEQYSIELRLVTNGEVDQGKVEEYKTFLNDSYADVTLWVVDDSNKRS